MEQYALPPEVLEAVKENHLEGALEACSYVEDAIADHGDWLEGEHHLLLQVVALLSSLRDAELIHYSSFEPVIDTDFEVACQNMIQFVREVRTALTAASATERFSNYKAQFSLTVANGFGYVHADGDIKRVQTLINDLRERIQAANLLDEEHRQRILKKLEALQAELHKKVSDFDRAYGLMADAFVLVRKLGEDAQPIVERVKEIVQICWGTQARAEGLPSGTEMPFLKDDSAE